MSEPEWIDGTLSSARPQALAALLRYFRSLDLAEEAFQEASLRALKSWRQSGPPRDPVAWLIFVGRNSGVDRIRRQSREIDLPDEVAISNLDDVEADIVDRLDGAHYRDDILRLLFICSNPALPATQQVALALRIVAGLTVPQIARAFLVQEKAMEQRITRAKARIAGASLSFETPGVIERAERLSAVAAMIYLVFNQGYSAAEGANSVSSDVCEEAIRLGRLLLRLFPGEPEVMGLTALLLLQHSRLKARFDHQGTVILLDDQDRGAWNRLMMTEAFSLLDKAMRYRRTGPYQVQAAIAALHARALTAGETDWKQIDLLYATLERLTPSPVISLNRSVAIAKCQGPEAALAFIAPLAQSLDSYFHFHATRGGLLLQVGKPREARMAFDRAIALSASIAQAAYIRMQLDRLEKEAGLLEPEK